MVLLSAFTSTQILALVAASGVISLVTAGTFRFLIQKKEKGSEKMEAIALEIRKGAMAFLMREYKVIAMFIAGVSILLFLFIDTGIENMRAGNWSAPWTAFCY